MLVALQLNDENRFNAVVERIKACWTTTNASNDSNDAADNDSDNDDKAVNAAAPDVGAADDDKQPKYLRSMKPATTAKLTLPSLMACATDVAACGCVPIRY
jgi:hypothetical protein